MDRKRTMKRVIRLLSIVASIILLLLGMTPSVGADGIWTNQTPATAPPARDQCAMSSVGGDQVLLFGGWDGANYLGDTWVYDLSANTWTSQAPAVAPSARRSHAMAYLGDDQVLLFGDGMAPG